MSISQALIVLRPMTAEGMRPDARGPARPRTPRAAPPGPPTRPGGGGSRYLAPLARWRPHHSRRLQPPRERPGAPLSESFAPRAWARSSPSASLRRRDGPVWYRSAQVSSSRLWRPVPQMHIQAARPRCRPEAEPDSPGSQSHRPATRSDFHMNALTRRFRRGGVMLVGLVLALMIVAPAANADLYDPADRAPMVWSDKADYAPGERVTLNGAHWTPGDTVNIVVNDDEGDTWRRDVDVTVADDGSISDQFNLPGWFVANYSVRATDGSSRTAAWSFTDSRLITAATLNGGTSAGVAPGASISARVNVTTGNAAATRTGGRLVGGSRRLLRGRSPASITRTMMGAAATPRASTSPPRRRWGRTTPISSPIRTTAAQSRPARPSRSPAGSPSRTIRRSTTSPLSPTVRMATLTYS